MGQLKTDGRAIDVVAPTSEEIVFGELYRIGKWNGFAMKSIADDATVRGFALEVAPDRIWYIQLPSTLTSVDRGDILWWSAVDGFKVGFEDLVAAGTSGAVGPACKVEEDEDANGVVAVRALNIS